MAHFFKHIGEDIKKYMSEMDEEMTPEDAKRRTMRPWRRQSIHCPDH